MMMMMMMTAYIIFKFTPSWVFYLRRRKMQTTEPRQ